MNEAIERATAKATEDFKRVAAEMKGAGKCPRCEGRGEVVLAPKSEPVPCPVCRVGKND